MSKLNIARDHTEEKVKNTDQTNNTRSPLGRAWKTISRNLGYCCDAEAEVARVHTIYMPHAIVNAPHSLTVVEMRVLGGVLVEARGHIKTVRHEYSLAGGEAEIVRFRKRVKNKTAIERKPSDKYDRRTMAYMIQEGIKAHGSDGYHHANDRFKLGDALTFTVRRTTLLSAAGMGHQNRDYHLLKAVLVRFQEPIVQGLPPLLTAVEIEANGKLRLTVPAEWLPQSGYSKIPWPLPEQGKVEMGLYLFLYGWCHDQTTDGIALDSLCRRIGITETRRWDMERQLRRALAGVNEQMRGLDNWFNVRKGGYVAAYPGRFAIVNDKIKNGRVRFRAIWSEAMEDQIP